MQWQTAVTAYLKSKQLMLFATACWQIDKPTEKRSCTQNRAHPASQVIYSCCGSISKYRKLCWSHRECCLLNLVEWTYELVKKWHDIISIQALTCNIFTKKSNTIKYGRGRLIIITLFSPSSHSKGFPVTSLRFTEWDFQIPTEQK